MKNQYPYVSPVSWEGNEPVLFRVAINPHYPPMLIQTSSAREAFNSAKEQIEHCYGVTILETFNDEPADVRDIESSPYSDPCGN